MIRRVNLLPLQRVADDLARAGATHQKELVEGAIHEICELREAMRKINDTALDALTEPLELQHFPGGGFGPKLPGETPSRRRAEVRRA